MTGPAQAFAREASLFPTCALPGCHHIVDEPGQACGLCRALWGPYLVRQGDRPVWVPATRPACGHGWFFWSNGRCHHIEARDAVAAAEGRPVPLCGNTATEPNPWPS